MLQTVEALVDENGRVRLLEAVTLPVARRALVTILDQAAPLPLQTALSPEDEGDQLESIKARLQRPLSPTEIGARQAARERLEILAEQLNADAQDKTQNHTLESLAATVAATYEGREREQL